MIYHTDYEHTKISSKFKYMYLWTSTILKEQIVHQYTISGDRVIVCIELFQCDWNWLS